MNRRNFLRNAGWVSTGLIFVPRLLRAQTPLTADGLSALASAPAAGGGGGGGPADTLNDASLVSYWRLDEASGTRNDTKGTNHLTDTGSTGSASAIISNGASFAASTHLGHASNSGLQTGNIDWSAGFWFNVPTPGGGGNPQALVGKFSEFAIHLIASTGALRFLTNSGSGAGANLDSAATISANTWYFVVVTYTAGVSGTKNIYVNAGTPDTISCDTLTAGTDDFTVGDVLNVWRLTGKVDEVWLTKRLVTTTEINGLYNSGAGARPAGL